MSQSLWQIDGLKRLLEFEMRVELIAEPLYVVDEDEPASRVGEELARRGTRVHEIAAREALGKGAIGGHAEPVSLSRIVSPATPLWACIDRLVDIRDNLAHAQSPAVRRG